MSDYIIETCSLTKMYGEQASVSDLSGLFDRIPRLLSQLDRNGKSENFCEAAWAERFQLH